MHSNNIFMLHFFLKLNYISLNHLLFLYIGSINYIELDYSVFQSYVRFMSNSWKNYLVIRYIFSDVFSNSGGGIWTYFNLVTFKIMVLYVSLQTTDTTIITPYSKITTLLPFDTISFFCTTLLLMTYSYCILNAYLLIDNWNKFLLRLISTNKILHELFYSLFYEY